MSMFQRFREVRRAWRAGNNRVVRSYFDRHEVRKLHLGCGDHELPEWLNTDLNPKGGDTAYLNVLLPFPFPGDAFDFVFSEHMIEHLSYEQGQMMLRECHRVMKPGGRIRIVTPDLKFLTGMHGRPKNEVQRRYVEWASRKWLSEDVRDLEAFTINHFVRAWGHQFIYDEASLSHALRQVGFHDIETAAIGESSTVDLSGLENESRMPEGFLRLESLTIEGVK